jgi:hypothetical protein
MADFPGKKLIENVINLNDLSGYSWVFPYSSGLLVFSLST